ncbi:hypothetical protein PENTCL1PPCAC_9127, partial [Pristionchus entomophagus]
TSLSHFSPIMKFLHILLISLLATIIGAIPIYPYAAYHNPYQLASVDQFASGTILEATGNHYWARHRLLKRDANAERNPAALTTDNAELQS